MSTLSMIPAGYMAKRVALCPNWLPLDRFSEIYSVSNHMSDDFADYISLWKHNGYWLFDSPEIIIEIAKENSIDLTGAKLFYYELADCEFDSDRWSRFNPEDSFRTEVRIPDEKTLEGYDVVTFSARTSPECSPLSCNGLALELEANEHCLLASIQQATDLLERGVFDHSEPGPYRVFGVYSVAWPGSLSDDLVAVYFGQNTDSLFLKTLLEGSGIPASLRNVSMSGGGTGAPYIRVFVARRDLERTQPLVEHFKIHGKKSPE